MTHEEDRIAADRDARELLEFVRGLTPDDLTRFLDACPIPMTIDQRAVFVRINARAWQGRP